MSVGNYEQANSLVGVDDIGLVGAVCFDRVPPSQLLIEFTQLGTERKNPDTR